jgi:hypothetical protein
MKATLEKKILKINVSVSWAFWSHYNDEFVVQFNVL